MPANYRFLIDDFDQQNWTRWLTSFPDANIYQTWNYGRLHSAGPMRQTSRMIMLDDDWPVAMIQLRLKGFGSLVPGVAECDYGPVWNGRPESANPSVLREFLAKLVDEFGVRRGFQLRIRPQHTFSEKATADLRIAFEDAGFKQSPTVRAYHTVVIDLSQTVEAIRKDLHQKWRNQLNGAERFGLTVERGRTTELFDRFRVIYDRMWAKKKFPTGVRIPLIRKMMNQSTESDRFIVTVVSDETSGPKQDVGATVCAAVGDTMLYFLGATEPEPRANCRPGYLMQWLHITLAKEMGFRYYDAGGYNEQDGPEIAQFKLRMGGQPIIYTGQYDAVPNIAAMRRYEFMESTFRNLRRRLAGR
jgi:lipid II:glycine glycyltransferase (peptidoglycan interpeptide bridge formation enzyme)